MTGAREKLRSTVLPRPDLPLTAREESAALRSSAETWGRMNLKLKEFAVAGVVLGIFLSATLKLYSEAKNSGDYVMATNCAGALILLVFMLLSRLRRDFLLRAEILAQESKMRRDLSGKIPSE